MESYFIQSFTSGSFSFPKLFIFSLGLKSISHLLNRNLSGKGTHLDLFGFESIFLGKFLVGNSSPFFARFFWQFSYILGFPPRVLFLACLFGKDPFSLGLTPSLL